MVEVQPDAFRSGPVPLLQHLDLAFNRLAELPASGLPEGLLHLDLANNLFRGLPGAVAGLAGLARLNLSANAIGEGALEERSLQSSALEQLDLSWNQLGRFPLELFADSADSLKLLRLAGNGIGQLEPGKMQNLTVLRELDLASNGLTGLELGVFEGLGELAILQLANNSIRHVDSEAFRPLATSLHSLGLSQNQLTELPVAVGRLTRVKRIDLSRNNISRAYKFVLNKLPHLARLDLSQNALESVDSYVFKECDHLQELNLRANRLQAISPDVFEKCPKLKRLDLAQNQLASLGPSLAGLKALRSVNLTGNALEELNWAQFPVDLMELLASGNRIKRIGPLEAQMDGDEGEGRKLKRLELKANQLARIGADSLPLYLEELDLSENELTGLANNSFQGMGQLKMANLRANRLRTIPRELFELAVGGNAPFGRMWIGANPLECNCEMGWLLSAVAQQREGATGGGVRDIGDAECLIPLSGQKKAISQTMPDDFLCPYSQFCEPGCVCCQYWNCDCKSRCPSGCQCFRDLHSVTNVAKCTGGGGQQELDFKELPMQASHILLSGLNMSTLKDSDFMGRRRLLELHINASGIQRIQPSAFNNLVNLRSLHLANNQLRQIRGDEANGTQNIQLLNLAGNKIEEIHPRLAAMAPRLEQLLLEGNALEELPQYLKNASGDQVRLLSLAQNPFVCDCASSELFDTPKWLARNRLRVLDSEEVLCVENVTRALLQNHTRALSFRKPNEGEDLFTMPMLHFLLEENSTICVAQSEGIFGIGSPFDTLMFLFAMVALLLVLPLLLLLLIRPGWFREDKARSQLEEKNGLLPNNNSSLSSTHSPTTNGGSPLPMPPSGQSQYVLLNGCDIFICYAKRDEMAVREICGPLECQGYIVCLLHQCGYYREDRAYISDELNNLIRNSRILLLILSREFLQKDWNTPQLASSFKLDKKQNEFRRILMIANDDMDEKELAYLPSELGKIWRLHGCLRRRNPRFWDELNRMLHPIRCPSPDNSETSQSSHIYGQIPPAQSEFV